MDDISIKILDALFDMCDGENYVILDEEDLTSTLSASFEPNELTEIFESLAADGLVSLKYADDHEFCVSLKTKGRTLIKQSRERLQRFIENAPESQLRHTEPDTLPAERTEEAPIVEPKSSDLPEEPAPAPLKESPAPLREHAQSRDELLRIKKDIIAERTHSFAEDKPRDPAPAAPVRPYAEEPEKKFVADRNVLLSALIGGVLGALIVNLIFLFVFLAKMS